ncbi:uncharacterized protein LOC114865921 isoform X2 [Betta splendens]|nr:uncharacterized protein LOC114865921 isoform X2 [Betta splendens]XP_055368939.1 uncharacterized protein LOC114865921 isoform X2 [Betta splendens]
MGAAMSDPSLFDLLDWDQLSNADGESYLLKVEQLVSQLRGKLFVDRSGSGVDLRIAGIDDTVYSEDTEVVDSWGKFYLPQEVKMCVFAVVEGPSSTTALVLMTCEDRKMYGYDGEDLHEVASDLKELCFKGLEYPASKSYYHGEAFKDMTDDEWAEVRKGAVGKRLDKEHQKLVKAVKSQFLESLS